MKNSRERKIMSQTKQMAAFALEKKFSDLSSEIVDQLKRHLLDSIGSMMYCLHHPTIQKLARQIMAVSSGGKCAVPLIGKTEVDRAAQYLTALIRFPDFMD